MFNNDFVKITTIEFKLCKFDDVEFVAELSDDGKSIELLQASYDWLDSIDVEKEEWTNIGGGYEMIFNPETGTLRYMRNGKKGGGMDLYKILGLSTV